MPTIAVNGVHLFYLLAGTVGPPLVLVHGSWGDHTGWEPVVTMLAQRFRVLTYDRRGHGQSGETTGPGSAEEDAADLAALIECVGLAPAHVAGISFGGAIALRLCAQRPDLVRSVTAQEPPLFALLVDDPAHGPLMSEVLARIGTVAGCLAAGDADEGTRRFFETVAFGPGAWEQTPPAERERLVARAPTFLDEARDPEAYTLDLTNLAASRRPILLTYGDRSPACFPPIVSMLTTVLPRAQSRAFAGAGHVPIASHPAEYITVLTAFTAGVDGDQPR